MTKKEKDLRKIQKLIIKYSVEYGEVLFLINHLRSGEIIHFATVFTKDLSDKEMNERNIYFSNVLKKLSARIEYLVNQNKKVYEIKDIGIYTTKKLES